MGVARWPEVHLQGGQAVSRRLLRGALLQEVHGLRETNHRQRWSGQHEVRGLREAGMAQRVLLLCHLQGLHGGQGLHTGRGEHHLSGVRQEEDHGGDGGEERVESGQKKEKQEGKVRTRETMRGRRSLKNRSIGCVHGSRRLGIMFMSRLGGPVGSVHGKAASMTKPSSCTYVLSSSCLCCKYMIVPTK